jgi:uncharacterized membrane protein YciS (DUF1049 family)
MTSVEGEMFARKVKIMELEQRIERLEKKIDDYAKNRKV